MGLEKVVITTVVLDENFCSRFATTECAQVGPGDRWLSEQQACVNFRYRSSPAGYESDWHVAGDPTLIVVCTGCLEIELRDGSKRRFSAGEKLIVRDFTPAHLAFDPLRHGHRARTIGDEEFSAVHFKLEKLRAG